MAQLFTGGLNIAIKIPKHKYEETLAFYRDVLGWELTEEEPGSPTISRSISCIHGPNKLWLDCVDNYSRSDVWLELKTENVAEATAHLTDRGVTVCDEIEPLPESMNAHWITDPASIVHLVTE